MESESQVKLYFGVIIVMIAFVIITGGFILAILRYQKRLYSKQQELLQQDVAHKKELLASSVESAETERLQIAKDIHDEIGSIFSTLSLSVNQLSDNGELNKNQLQTSKNLIQSGIDSVRRISHAIVPFELELLGLEQTIENYLETLGSLANIEISFDTTASLEKLNTNATVALYRIVQELGSNCIKYAQAKHLTLVIKNKAENICLTYADDGIGVDLKGKKQIKGIGLKNIESRVILLEGTLKFISEPNRGFNCEISIPLNNNSTP